MIKLVFKHKLHYCRWKAGNATRVSVLTSHHRPAGFHTLLLSHPATIAPLLAPSVCLRLQSLPLRQGINEQCQSELDTLLFKCSDECESSLREWGRVESFSCFSLLIIQFAEQVTGDMLLESTSRSGRKPATLTVRPLLSIGIFNWEIISPHISATGRV